MKIITLNDSKQGIGGGWTFKRNLEKAMTNLGHSIVTNLDEADIAFVAGPTMVTRETIDRAEASNAKLIVRLDNVPRNSRNRNTGTSRLKEFANRADEIVWQCNWAKFYLEDFIGRLGKVIYNGVDTEIFSENKYAPLLKKDVYMYSRFNRDETKNWEVAWYKFQLIARENENARLVVVGRFSPEQIQYNFDFFRGEKVSYLGVVDSPNYLASIYRNCEYLLATYFNDCYSNTYQEALACGCKLYEPDLSGGTPELIKNGVITLDQMGKEYEKLFIEVLNR